MLGLWQDVYSLFFKYSHKYIRFYHVYSHVHQSFGSGPRPTLSRIYNKNTKTIGTVNFVLHNFFEPKEFLNRFSTRSIKQLAQGFHN